ncbi:MAG: universal stress protein [Deltaproteobacteria bacterium]|nr:universal stress protein [Deltaproteobacteria bacterium]
MLFVTQFEELWFNAIESLMDLRKAGFNHFVFLHVIKREEVALRRGVGYLKEEEVKLREMANVRFIDWAESLYEQGMEVGAYVSIGDPVNKIVDTAKEEDVHLIVTGRHRKTKLLELLACPEAIGVVRRAPVPVLVYKYMLPSGKINDKPFERPLFATDFSSASDRAISYLLQIKNVIGKLEIIHVVSETQLKDTSTLSVQRVRKEYRKKLERIRNMFMDAGLQADSHLYVGNLEEQVQKATEERGASMVVVGKTSKKTVKEDLLGSLPKKLVEESLLPVLLIPSEVDD